MSDIETSGLPIFQSQLPRFVRIYTASEKADPTTTTVGWNMEHHMRLKQLRNHVPDFGPEGFTSPYYHVNDKLVRVYERERRPGFPNSYIVASFKSVHFQPYARKIVHEILLRPRAMDYVPELRIYQAIRKPEYILDVAFENGIRLTNRTQIDEILTGLNPLLTMLDDLSNYPAVEIDLAEILYDMVVLSIRQ